MINVFLYDSTLPQKLLIPDPPTAEHFSLFRIKDSHSSGCGKKGFVSGIGKATRVFKLTGYPIIFHRRTQTCSQGLPGGFPCYLPLKILKGEFPANSSGCPCCPVSPSLLRQREDFLKGCASVSANEFLCVFQSFTITHKHLKTLDFSICIFPLTQCAPLPDECLLAFLQDQDPFSDKFLKNAKNAF